MLQEMIGQADLAARYAGQRFFLLMVDSGPRAATKQTELVRQSINRITFRRGEESIHVTTHAGLAVVTREDTLDTLLPRLEAAVDQAKLIGANCSMLHNGNTTEPIDSPNLGAKYREIAI